MLRQTPDFGILNCTADRIWFTAGTHFCHPNSINHCHRPYNDVNERNESLIYNWNETVPEDSIVFHLEDFGFGVYWRGMNFSKKLNGKNQIQRHKQFKDKAQ